MLHNTSYGLELRQSGGLPKHWCHQTHLQLTVSSLNLVAFFKKKNRLTHKKICDVWNVLNNFQCFKANFSTLDPLRNASAVLQFLHYAFQMLSKPFNSSFLCRKLFYNQTEFHYLTHTNNISETIAFYEPLFIF